jgi:hypothetical protein
MARCPRAWPRNAKLGGMTNSPLLPAFREVRVPGGDLQFEQLRAQIERVVVSGWSLDPDSQKRLSTRDHDWVVVRRDASQAGPALRVFLTSRPGLAYVSNIVPEEHTGLTHEQYNDAALEFAELFARPAAEALGLGVTVTGTVLDLSAELPDDVFRALRSFSTGANKGTGSTHPMDRERWFSFIFKLHRSATTLSSTTLAEWLVADGWDEGAADDLAIEFELCSGLLEYVDDQQ